MDKIKLSIKEFDSDLEEWVEKKEIIVKTDFDSLMEKIKDNFETEKIEEEEEE